MSAIALRERVRGLVLRDGRPLRFLIAGGVNTAFGLVIYPLLVWASPSLHRHYLVALAIAQATSVCFAFATYKLAVFRSRGNVVREASLFTSFYVVNYAANWVALPILVAGLKIPPVYAQTGFSVLLIAGSYFWHSRLTFRPPGKS